MRHLILTFALLFSIHSFASHLLGGNITWECAGNNQYIFTLELYKDCSASATTFAPTKIINGPNGTMTLNLVSVKDFSIACYNNSNGCGNIAAVGTELWTYKNSTPVTLTGTPPPAGWEFSHFDCCHANTVNNGANVPVYIRSRMYSSGIASCYSSPYFISNPSQPITSYNNSLNTVAQSPQASDSLYYRFATSQSAVNTPAPYTTGYTANSPFPSTNTNSANGPVSMHGQSGTISYSIPSGTTGLYYYTTVVEQWRGNILVAEIFRDATAPAIFNTTPANNMPFVVIDTTLYPQVHRNGNFYRVDAAPGDTLSFTIVANDANFNPNTNNFQNIKFSAKGYALDTLWGGTNNFNSKATFTPAFPQTGFVTSLSNKVRFNWIVGVEHLQGASAKYFFNISFNDDYCPAVGIHNSVLQVNVREVASIAADTIDVCDGDSLTLAGSTASGNYSWSPANTLMGANTATPTAYTSTSQYYYLVDSSNPGYRDSVYVNVVPRGTFNLAFSAGQLQVTDNAQTVTRVWYYNGIPFNYAYDTLTPFGLGDYYIVAKAGACEYVSDTVSITSGMSFSVTAPDNGGYSGSPSVHTGSLGVTFAVNQNVNVSWVSIPGITDLYGKTGGYDLNLKVYDDTQTEIFSADVTLNRPMTDVLKVPVSLALSPNKDYTIAVSGDTGYAFSLYGNMNLPATPQNVGITVKSALIGQANQYPATPAPYMLPISMGIDRTVSLEEELINGWNIYPNPASGHFIIDGLQAAESIQLINMGGSIMLEQTVDEKQTSVVISRNNLPSGLYLVKVQSLGSVSFGKVHFK